MIHRFDTCLLKQDESYLLRKVDGTKNILTHAEKESYEYEEVVEILDKVFYADRRRFGWTVKFVEENGQKKEMFIRGSTTETCNYTTRSNQSIKEWIDRVYDKEVKQVSLF